MPLEVEIPVKEVQRYMGYHGIVDIEPGMMEKINKAVDQVSIQSHPRIISREFPVTVKDNNVTLHDGTEEISFESDSSPMASAARFVPPIHTNCQLSPF